MVTKQTFASEADAIEAWSWLDQLGRQRNCGHMVAFRDRATVYIRPEFVSATLCRELEKIAEAFMAEGQ